MAEEGAVEGKPIGELDQIDAALDVLEGLGFVLSTIVIEAPLASLEGIEGDVVDGVELVVAVDLRVDEQSDGFGSAVMLCRLAS